MSITMYTGRPGTGKTYSLVREVLRLLDRGNIVYANFYIAWNGYSESDSKLKKILRKLKIRGPLKKYPASNLRPWSNLNDLIKISGAYVAIDEAHLYMNSRRWKELPMEFMMKVAQHRKDAIHLIGTVQNIKRIDVVVREVVDYWYECRIFLWWVINTEYDIDEDMKKEFPLKKKWYKFRKEIATRYDTLAKIKME